MADDLIIQERGKPIFVKDPDTGEVLAVERDDRYIKATNDFWAAECKHADKQVMRVPVAGGAIQVRSVCMNCGERVGQAQSQKNAAWVATLPLFTQDTTEGYQSRRYRERHTYLLNLARIQHAERGKFTTFYRNYMKSPEWYEKRDLVLKRCGGVCEGCGIAPATEAHHVTYRHFGNEFLFELLGLCHGCHERIHAEDAAIGEDEGAGFDEDNWEEAEEYGSAG